MMYSLDVQRFALGKFSYGNFLLLVAGLGGLLFGVDVGIIGSALPYLEATAHLNANQLSIIVAAVLLGTVISTLIAGMLADWMGRKPLMILSGILFVLSIPTIALSHGYGVLFAGRFLQGISGGLIGVVAPLYLAECLPASARGKGTAIFQWLLTLGIVLAAVIGIYYSYRVAAVERVAEPAAVLAFKNEAWRRIFWSSMPPGILFVIGCFFLAESPRWLFQRGRIESAYSALVRSRSTEQAQAELRQIEQAAAQAASAASDRAGKARESLLRRKYVAPFLLVCAILLCNQATGVNSLVAYNTNVLLQSGLSDVSSHWSYVAFTFANFLATIIGMTLVDKRGRRFLFILGTAGIIVSTVSVGFLFFRAEGTKLDCTNVIQSMIHPDQALTLRFDPAEAQKLLNLAGHAGSIQAGAQAGIHANRASLAVVYSCGGYTAATTFARSDEADAAPIRISRSTCVPSSRAEALLKNPFASLKAARTAPLKIQKAYIEKIPAAEHGWMVAAGLYIIIAFYALGPGVCVWLALSELMPTRIRSNGMSIALVLNQVVSTIIAALFLPVASKYGYSTIFFFFATCTVVYLLVVAIFLPETKGKTLEEIETYFETFTWRRKLVR